MALVNSFIGALFSTGLLESISFWFLATVVISSAVCVVIMKNLVHSVLWLAVTMLGIAGVFVLLDAEFLAVVQILVYAGAVCIMVVFGVMVTEQGSAGQFNLFNRQTFAAVMTGLTTIIVCIFVGIKASWPTVPAAVPSEPVEQIANALLTKYVIPFEIAAVLLLVALFGAIVLAKEADKVD